MGSTGVGYNQMNVPYDKWGTFMDGRDIQTLYDDEGSVIGNIEDRIVYITEHQLDKIEKRDAINFALGFYSKLDGGWLVDDDYTIYLAYQDGTFRDVADNPEKPLNRKGLIGVYVSTPDEEISWGGNTSRHGFQQWGVHDDNGDEVQGDYHSWYKTTGSYYERVKTTYNNLDSKGRYRTRREVIRKSTIRNR